MNDPSRAIDVNLSSLLSLKAELLRKQAEVNKAKATRAPAEEFTPSRSANAASNKKVDKQQARAVAVGTQGGDATIYEHEDTALLEKSKRVLEAKSKYYERMRRTGGQLNSDDNCLVLFNRKRQEEGEEDRPMPPREESEQSSDSSDSGADDDDADDDLVEYTDCLGRTRKCLRRELQSMKERDAELARMNRIEGKRIDQSKPNWMLDANSEQGGESDDDAPPVGPLPPSESIYSDGCSLISKHDEQRANWERKEQENLGKEDVHYQDVFFDEARQHGVGYYAFSTDEEERKRQQDELQETRQKTIEEQERRDALRAQRERIIAERVRAAKNRQRARLGLPPLTEEAEEKAKGEVLTEENESKDARKARRKAEKLQKQKEEEERARELEREKHIRPWDRKKDGVPDSTKSSGLEDNTAEPEWTYKAVKEPLSQAEWNETQRAVRNPEFAPLAEQQPARAPLKRTHFSSMPPPPAPPPAHYNIMPPPLAAHAETFVPFQSSKRERQRQFQRRNYTDDESGPPEQRSGAAIPPPANLDGDYAPSLSKQLKSSDELERSIEAGLRFLRDNCDKGTMSTKSSWTAKADY